MTTPLHQRMAELKGHQCASKGCPMPVFRIGKWCKRHGPLFAKYGSPTGRRLKRKDDYQREYLLVTELVNNNREHPGLVRAEEWLSQFFPPEEAGKVVPVVEPQVKPESRKALSTTFLRLSPQGVTPLDVILESAALYLVSEWRPHTLSDDLALTRQIGTQVVYLATRDIKSVWMNGEKQYRPKRIPNQTRHHVGAAIRGALGSLMLNMARTVVAKVASDEQAVHDQGAPFITT
jgi:hypothetical protein